MGCGASCRPADWGAQGFPWADTLVKRSGGNLDPKEIGEFSDKKITFV